ncbi:helix-turn-helix domain-containing protein [Yinghuangia sp. YIM S09857]|uniref:helix-turn-helix domain-containing protein n=1 Tax=Yinghuangia sp. YIM S09857 TaxID=3436929 RepID=UPI003F52BDFB
MRTTKTARFRLKRLGSELQRHRKDAGLTLRDVADRVGYASSKVSRQETGQAGIKPGELERLLALYRIDPELCEDLRALLGEDQVREWWVRYEDVLTPSQFVFLAMENAARSILDYELTAIPGLLQTRDYARAVNAASVRHLSAEQMEATVEVRLRRQRRLIDTPKLNLHVLLWEGALCVETGGRAVMRDQLQHLVSVSGAPNVTLQVVPFAAGSRGVLVSAFQIMQFPGERDHDQLFIESIKGTLATRFDREVTQCAALFDQASSVALDPGATSKLLLARARGL